MGNPLVTVILRNGRLEFLEKLPKPGDKLLVRIANEPDCLEK